MEDMRYLNKEVFKALLLDSKGGIISIETISVGELNSTLVHPREAFVQAVKKSAAAVVFVHNHPSGDPTPSREDIRVTRKILEAGEMLEIRLADHLVIGDRCYTSMKEAGYLESYERE